MSVSIHPEGQPPGNAQPRQQQADPPAPAQPASRNASLFYVTDANGRSIGWKRLNALEDFELVELAGARNAENGQWMAVASIAYSVREIDGEAVGRPTSMMQVKGMIQRLDTVGLQAIANALAEMAAATESIERAKN